MLASLTPAENYGLIGIMVLVATGMAIVTLILTHIIGPRRSGDTKLGTYESGVDPIGDTRRRFNVRFYLVAVLYLVLALEVLFLVPFVPAYHALRDHQQAAAAEATVSLVEAGSESTETAAISPEQAALVDRIHQVAESGYSTTFLAVGILLFFVLLPIGLLYEWQKGIYSWD